MQRLYMQPSCLIPSRLAPLAPRLSPLASSLAPRAPRASCRCPSCRCPRHGPRRRSGRSAAAPLHVVVPRSTCNLQPSTPLAPRLLYTTPKHVCQDPIECDPGYNSVMPSLLAIDLGLRTGLAVYGSDGKLRRYGSHNFGSAARLRRGVVSVLAEPIDLERIYIEGGGPLADIWVREAERRGISVRLVSAETWRRALLYEREQRNGDQAKRVADTLARRVIAWSGATRPTALRHDTAEAILIGLWGVLDAGWLERLPDDLRH